MIVQREDEGRLQYLVRVAAEFCRTHGENTIDYDDTTCDGLCLAEELDYARHDFWGDDHG